MKTYLPYSLILAAAASGLAFGAETAYTTPVGYVTMNVAGGGSGASPKLSYIGPSLTRSATFQGVSLGTGIGSTVDFAAVVTPPGPFTISQFGLNSLGEPKYYAEIVSGVNTGLWTDILSNTATSITLADPIASSFASQTIVIRQHHSLASLFGTTAATIPFQSALTISGADELVLLDSITQVPSVYYFSTDDSDEDGNQDGWVRSNGVFSSEKLVSPTDGLTVRRKAVAALAITQSGDVKMTQTKLRIDTGFNILPVNRAVGSTLRLSPLTATGASDGRTGSNLVGSGFTSGLTLSTADELTILVNGNPAVYYFSLDDADEDGFADGWVKSDGSLAGALVIPEGSGLRLRRKSVTPFTWTIPAEPLNQSPIVGVSN